MRVEKLMDLGELAELMGSETTEREAELMRQFLIDDDYYDTDDVSESEWLEMIRDAVVLAADEAASDDAGPTESDLSGDVKAAWEWLEASAGQQWASADEATNDAGPTEADLRGEVEHGG